MNANTKDGKENVRQAVVELNALALPWHTEGECFAEVNGGGLCVGCEAWLAEIDALAAGLQIEVLA